MIIGFGPMLGSPPTAARPAPRCSYALPGSTAAGRCEVGRNYEKGPLNRISLLASVDPPQTLCDELEQRVKSSFDERKWDLLDAIDYLIQVDWDELMLPDIINDEPLPGSDKPSLLQRILVEGGSAYHVSIPHQRLERRIDETAAKAFERSATVSGDEAARHLRQAWTAIYGLHPDPTTAYREAVGTVASGPEAPPRDSKVEAVPVRMAVRSAQSDQS